MGSQPLSLRGVAVVNAVVILGFMTPFLVAAVMVYLSTGDLVLAGGVSWLSVIGMLVARRWMFPALVP